MKAFWTYTLARLGIFVATYAVLALLAFGTGMFEFSELTNLLVLIVALVISSVISLFALAGLRNRFAEHVQARAERMTERIEESRRAEDVD